MIRLDATTGVLDDRALEALRGALSRGGVTLFPTETFYGIGCRPAHRDAVRRLVGIKGRPDGKPLPLLAAGEEEALSVARLDARTLPLWRRLAGEWPAPLTLVVTAAPGLAEEVTAGTGEVAVRVSSLPLARQVARAAGGLVVATSANRSGAPPCSAAAAARAALPESDLLVDGGETPGGLPSTLVRLTQGRPEVLRPGAVSEERVHALLKC